ncbi:Uncharacterized protein SCF082_LOCUS6841 [Durusdinium trenchii]|uniref:Uncharacterized protein n=1 Tax=Durusdinium trenchii TaxID=1381693 RepID=A0ABP0IGR1_9DINO
MPPKKKQKKEHLALPAADDADVDMDPGPSKEHLMKVHDALAVIYSHEMFKDILTAEPLSVKDGGREASLDLPQAASALKNVGVYKCAANFFHQDFLFLATHKVPINSAQVQQIKQHWFPSNEPPSLCPFTVTVALETPACIGKRPDNGFQRLSPPEPVHALLFALAEAIETKAKVGVLRALKNCILTATFVFEICPIGEQRYWRAANIREEMVEKGLSVQMSLRCQEVLEWCDQNWLSSNAWKSVYALQALIDRAGTPELIAWSLEGMVDGVRMSFIDAGFFVISKLKDSRQSYIEVLKMKRKTLNHCLNQWLNTLELSKEWKEKIRNFCGSFDNVRKHLSPYPDTQADTAWLLGCPPSVTEICDFLDALVYGSQYDLRYKDAIKSKREVQDFLNYPSLKSTMENIEQKVRQETTPEATQERPAEIVAAETEPQPQETEAASASEAAAASESTAPSSTALSEADKALWLQHMRKVLAQHVRFVSDHRTNVDLEKALKETPFMSLRGDPTGLGMFLFDLKKYGEPTTRPDLRTATFREPLYTKLVKSVLTARQEVIGHSHPNLMAGDVAVVFDAGKKGLRNKLMSPWKEGTAKSKENDEEDEEDAEEDQEDEDKPTFCADTLMIGYSESSLAARKKRVRGTCTLKQMEGCHIFTSKKLSLPSRDRKHFAGSTTGDLIANVHMPPWSSEWHLPWKEKKELLGKKHQILVGGKTHDKDDGDKQNSRSRNGSEPVCYHSPPYELCEELIHDFFVKMIIDLTPLDARMAWAALRNRVGYVGIAFNPEHQRLLEERLLTLLEKDMKDPESPLFSAAYAEAEEEQEEEEEQENAENVENEDEEEVWDPLADDE